MSSEQQGSQQQESEEEFSFMRGFGRTPERAETDCEAEAGYAHAWAGPQDHQGPQDPQESQDSQGCWGTGAEEATAGSGRAGEGAGEYTTLLLEAHSAGVLPPVSSEEEGLLPSAPQAPGCAPD